MLCRSLSLHFPGVCLIYITVAFTCCVVIPSNLHPCNVHAFLHPTAKKWHHHTPTLETQRPTFFSSTNQQHILHMFYNDDSNNNNNNNNEEDPDLAMEHNNARTSITQFLTQRSIQSFMFLCEQVRDPHTADWVERLLGKTDLLNYHGTGAFNVTKYPTWDAFFTELICQPKTSIIVQAKRRGRGHGGWSKVRI